MEVAILSGICITILFAYGCFLMYSSFIWRKAAKINPQNSEIHNTFSVIVPFRNESNNIVSCLHSISAINYPTESFEVIFIDDHSSDQSLELLKEASGNIGMSISILQLPENAMGKKEAITYGIENSKNDYIITLDADCTVLPLWLNTMNDTIIKEDAAMVVGPVKIAGYSRLFEQFQALDFTAMVGFGAVSLLMGKPVLANGANLMYRKKYFMDVGGFGDEIKYASGDDVFLLHRFKNNYPNRIHFLKSVDAVVTTSPTSSINEFWQQKIRWASKSVRYKDKATLLNVLGLLFLQIIILINIGLALNTDPLISVVAIFGVLLKFITELIYIAPILNFFQQRKLVALMMPLQIFYPVYILGFAILAPFLSYTWKGRRINKISEQG